jgi:CheY-like chemotaxis protein
MARVLVADDDAILRDLLAVWLEMSGHTPARRIW